MLVAHLTCSVEWNYFRLNVRRLKTAFFTKFNNDDVKITTDMQCHALDS